MQFSDVPENLHACRQVNHSTSIPDDDDVGKPVKERNLIFFLVWKRPAPRAQSTSTLPRRWREHTCHKRKGRAYFPLTKKLTNNIDAPVYKRDKYPKTLLLLDNSFGVEGLISALAEPECFRQWFFKGCVLVPGTFPFSQVFFIIKSKPSHPSLDFHY